MSATWYKLRIEKQKNEYECYIRFRFDFQMQSIRIKAFLYLIDSEGNITFTNKKNKLGYDPRIVGSLVIEKNFLKRKRRNNSNNKDKDKDMYFEVMKYQGNFNICNLPLIDDYFRNGKALIYQYNDLINMMNNKKYKIKLSPKKFTIILEVPNYRYICLNLFNKLEEVKKQELIFLEQNEESLCHRYCSKKFLKNNEEGDKIEIIEEKKNFNILGGRIYFGDEDNDKSNAEDKKEIEDNFDDFFIQNEKDYETNSDDSSFYDSNPFIENNNNEELNINNFFFNVNGKDFNIENKSTNIILNNNETSSKNSKKSTKKSKIRYSNFNNNSNINKNDENNENYNNLFTQLKQEDDNMINNMINNKDNYQIKNSIVKSNKKELNFYEKAKNIVNQFNFQKDSNINNTKEEYSSSYNKIKNNDNIINNINNNFKLLCNRIVSQKENESLISNESEKKILLCSSGFDNTKYNLNLLYKSTLHGDDIFIFHKRCDNKKNIFLIILTIDNNKFGFYSSVGLSTDKKIIYDNNAFLFKLDKAEMDCFHIKNSEIALYGVDDYILYLGGDQLIIKDKFLSKASSCGTKMQNYKIDNNYQINNGNKNFIIKELEVYNISEI